MAMQGFDESTRRSGPPAIAWASSLRSVVPLSASQQPYQPSNKRRTWSSIARDVLQASQVELRGQYSVERMLALASYDRQSSKTRVAAALVLSFAPCLLAVMLIESIPLAPIELGLAHSRNLWIRSALGVYFTAHTNASQFAIHFKSVKLSRWQIIAIASVTTALQVPTLLAMTLWIGYPLPFLTVMGVGPFLIFFGAAFACAIQRQVRNDPSILAGFHAYGVLSTAQVSLMFIYPTFTYVFNYLGAPSQTVFAMLLPMIKLMLKNLFAIISRNIEDVRPELVVFNVEIFSALYVSSCMQSAVSLSTTLVIMTMDFVQACFAIKELNDTLDDKELRRLLLPHHSAKTDYRHALIPLAMHIVATNPEVRSHASIQIRSCLGQFKTQSFESLCAATRDAVVPLRRFSVDNTPIVEVRQSTSLNDDTPQRTTPTALSQQHTVLHDLQSFVSANHPIQSKDAHFYRISERLSTTEQLHVVQKTLQILHIAEFVALVEYAEVFVPIVYSLFCVIAYTFPNTAYYSMLATLTPRQFVGTLASVLLYGLLELVSFVALGVVVWRKFRVSVFTQCAFVLESQWGMVQSKLTLWLVMVLQFALAHYGNDFSFKFAWLQRQQ